MDTQLKDNMVDEYRKKIFSQKDSYKREIFTTLSEDMKNHNLLLIGLRQIGKTTLLEQLAFSYYENQMKQNKKLGPSLNPMNSILYINVKAWSSFDNYAQHIQQEITNSKYRLILIDEIQEIEKWSNMLQAAIDLNKNARFIVSGSNHKALTDESMVGRIKIYNIYPLSFVEYKNIWLNDDLDVFLDCGSYPKSKNYDSAYIQYMELVQSVIIDKILSNDLKNNIDSDKFNLIIKDIKNYIGNEINYQKINTKTNVARQTITDYIKHMYFTKLIHLIPKYKDKNEKPKHKIYFEDKSMINYFNQGQKLDNNLSGSLIENVVFNHLMQKYYFMFSTKKINYFRNKDNKEIDFLLEDKKILLECKYRDEINMEELSTELNNTIENNEELKDYTKIVITKKHEGKINNWWFIPLMKLVNNEVKLEKLEEYYELR